MLPAMEMTNRGNLDIYRRWAPIYDATVEHLFAPARRRSIDLLGLRSGERVLLVGVGTGSDLPLLPSGVVAVGTDLSAAMLDRAREKLGACRARVELVEGDAQTSLVPEESFDAAALHLILSVVPDARACLDSTLRALRPGGRLVVFDKFRPDHAPLSWLRRVVNGVSSRLGTDVTRRLGDVIRGAPCRVVHDEASLAGGLYRIVLLQKSSASEPFADGARGS
jgi:phosphatidylethanolamine/phosphatidyl-N-methylethanolamine N-methyltransferase